MLTEQKGIQVDKFYPPTDWQYSFPEGYTRLEYIESTGTQYINTGIYGNQDTTIKIKGSTTNSGTQVYGGCSTGGNLWEIGQQSSGNYLFGQYYTQSGNERILTNYAGNDGIARTLELRKNEFYIDGQLIGSRTAKTFTTTTIKLFTLNPSSSKSSIKMYLAQIEDENGNLVFDGVPVIRNSDNEIGMLDRVSGQFFGNVGTGTFIAGPSLYQNHTQIDIRQKNNLNFGERYKFNENNELTWANPNLYLLYANGEKHFTTAELAPVPAGLNYNNTTTPSIGYVNTQTQVFIPAPIDGIKYSQTRDIKVIPPEDNTITLLYGVKSDFSKYSLFGLLANVSSGTYDVYIDDVLYATTASETQTDIDFSSLGSEYVPIGTCTTPEALVLHKIVIKPTMIGETITRFACRRTTGATGTQQQGILWANLQLENIIQTSNCFGTETAYNNRILYAVTAKNNKITVTSTNTTGLYSIYARCASLVYSPILEYSTKDYINGVYLSFDQTKLKRITIKNNPSINMTIIRNAQQLEKIDIENPISLRSGTASGNSAQNAYKLELLPKYETETQTCDNINMYDTTSLYPTKINDSTNKLREFLRMYGSSTYPMRGLRGLKVSNEAPFSGSSPQINVSYTGLDRDALVELFNSLPDVSEATDGITRTLSCVAATGNNLTVVGSPTIDANGVASGFSADDYLNVKENINLSSNFKIQIKITPSSVTTGSKKFLSIFYTNSIYLDFYTSGTTPRIDCQYSGGAYWSGIATNLSYDIPIVITIKGNGTNLNIDINQNNVTQTGTKTLQELGISDINATVYLGRGHATSLPMVNGTIDLENTYIKVDNNYLMKGYLTDNDRLIATNKGWTITG